MEMAVGIFCSFKKGNREFIRFEDLDYGMPVPYEYGQKIMQDLARHGIVETKRGPKGGGRRANRKVTLYDIWSAIEGPIHAGVNGGHFEGPLAVFTNAMDKVVL